jgi:6-phosphogluconolactonase
VSVSRSLIYVACAASGTVDVLSLDAESGTLERLGRTEGLDHLSSMALDAEGPTLYAACNIDRPAPQVPPRVVALSLDASGAASPRAERELPVTTCYIALTPDRRELFGASYHEGRLIRFAVPGDASDSVSMYASGANTHCSVLSPDGRFVYAASLGDDRISWFTVDGSTEERTANDGAIASDGHVAVEHGTGPRHLRFNAAGDRAYVLHELSGGVRVFERDAETGRLGLLQTVSAVEGLDLSRGAVRSPSTQDPGQSVIWCADLRLTPDGRFLFASERSTSTISTFAVRDDGLLEYLRRTPTEAQPRGTAIDPSGQFLLVCGERSDHVTAYRIDDDGELTLASRAATSVGPLWIECWTPA